MPELPEVEVVKQGLEASLTGKRLLSVQVRESRLRWPVSEQLNSAPLQQVLSRLTRRGKYLLMHFDAGVVISHLGMTGNWRWIPLKQFESTALRKHDHVDMQFEHGVLRYYDPRRFGALLWHDKTAGLLEGHPLLAKLGIEPLDSEWDGGLLFRASRGRSVSVKQFLLAGHVVVGVGNIYCSEALFRAGIRPMCAAGKVTAKQYLALGEAIKLTLSMAVKKGGSTLKDFAGADGASGYFQQEHLVYDRAGLPCRVCSMPIKSLRQGQRSTFYCAKCQK